MSWRAATKALYEAGGGPLRRMDYTLAQTIYTAGWCVGYMDASKHREPPSAGGPRVHEAPQGLTR